MYSIDYLYQIFGGFENFLYFCAPKRRGARVVEEARLESVYTPKGYPGFESPSLRWKELQNEENPCKLILYRDFLFLVHGKNKHIKAFFRLSSFLVGIIFYTREVLLTHSFHLKRISVGNRRKSIACVINKNERNLASTI